MRNPKTTKKILKIKNTFGISGPKIAGMMNITPATFRAKKTDANPRNWFNKKNLKDLTTFIKVEAKKI